MKLILGVMSLILCTAVGYYLSRKYSEKKSFYNDFLEFNKKLKNEISFSQSSLISIIKKSCNKNSVFCKNITAYFVDKSEILLDKSIFTTEETEYFNGYLKNIGLSDRQTQLNYLGEVDMHLTEKAKKSSDDEKKYKSLYIKMGFLIGLVALIILI